MLQSRHFEMNKFKKVKENNQQSLEILMICLFLLSLAWRYFRDKINIKYIFLGGGGRGGGGKGRKRGGTSSTFANTLELDSLYVKK